MTQADAHIALALGGGAALGWSHIGVLQTLTERGVRVGAIAGTSIGSVVAASFAAGKLADLERIARGATALTVIKYLDLHWKPGAVLGGREVARQLITHFGDSRLEDLAIPCAAVAADLLSGEEVVIASGPLVPAIQASVAIPGIFAPIAREGRLLADGGLVTPVPVRAARRLSNLPVVAVNLQGDYVRRADAAGLSRALAGSSKHPSTLSVTRASIGCLLTALARMSLRLDPADVDIAPAVGHIDVGDFTKADELIAIGRAAAQARWPQIEALIKSRP
jgi:NTE family protein